MKPRLPHRLIQALLTTCAATLTSTFPALADVPEGYTEVPISSSAQLNIYKSSDYIAFLLLGDIHDLEYAMTGNHQYWGGTGSSEEPSLTFSSLNSQYGTSAIQAKGELWMECLQNIHFNSNGTNKHSASGCKSYGGAIYVAGSARINNNHEVLFDGNFNKHSSDSESRGGEDSNSAYIYGGAVYIASEGVMECNNNRKIQLINNAITISFADYYSSSPTKNYVYGGAIAAGDSATLCISKNDTVDISSNKTLATYYSVSGGILYDSSWSYGGAIYVGSGTKNLIQDNVDVSIKNNSSTANPYHGNAYAYGGALYIGSKSSLTISGNSSAAFSDNYARATYVRDVLHGARSYSYGGALYISESSSVEIKENSDVEFANNYVYSSAYDVARGGAIYAAKGTSIAIENNERCIFRGNAQVHTDSEFVFENSLNSIYSIGNEITLKVGEGQEILFYDPIYAKADTGLLTISYNAKHTNSESDSICPSGDIVFSALYAQEDLAKHKPNYEQSELSASKRTEIYAITHLYGGRLRVEDGAMYMGNGIIAEINSAATVLVKNATLSHSGYDLSFNAGTTLDLGGVNSITAKTLDMKDGSIMSFTLGKDNLTTAAVTLTGTFKQGGALTISLADDGTMERENKYALLTIASGATPETWDISKLTVEGIGATLSDLSWSNGTLYYSAPLPELLTATWSGGQSRVWNTSDKNWTQGEYSYAYKDGVDVVFGDTGSGSVALDGSLEPRSVLVENSTGHDYTWAGSGKLTGETTLTKSGDGKLTINTANDYTGGTILNGGTLVVGSDTALGAGVIQLNGGMLNLAEHTIDNNLEHTAGNARIENGVIAGNIALSGGELILGAGASYQGAGIVLSEESAATLRLDNASLEHSDYAAIFNSGTTLDLAGVNSITASTLEMLDGSTLSFNTGATEGVMLNLDAVLKTGSLNVTVSGDLTKEYSLLQLADVTQYDFTQWNSGQVSVSGTDYEHLIWKDGVLSYKPWESTHTDVKEDSEIDDFGGEEGADIDGGGHSLTVKHPVDLVHLAMKDGVVKLEGAENNVVRITLTEDGTLQLAAGAGLNVGNIVSMVANGSADLEISGDIEISDIKAYGKPDNKGTLSYVNMTTAGDYTIENMTITGSVIDVGEGTTLYLVNVDIKSDTHITDDPAWVFAQNANIQLDKTNTWVDQEITAAQDTLLYMSGDTQRSITMAAGSEIVELTSSMFDSVTLTGTDLWLDMTKIAGLMPNTDYITIQFKDLVKAQVDVENLKVYATIDGETYRQAYAMTDHGTTTTLYFALPEPTTTTLSLLALAALAARRRRMQ